MDNETSGVAAKGLIMLNQKLAEKSVIRKFEKIKGHSPFIDHVWAADVADMQSGSKFNRHFIFIMCYWHL